MHPSSRRNTDAAAKRLRISPAVWFSPFLAILAVMVSYSDITLRMPEAYPLALTATGASSIFLVAPICAACAVWEAGRLRRAGWLALPHVRSTIALAFAALAPVLIAGLMAITVAIVVKFLGAGVLALPDVRVMGKTLAIIVAHALLGFAIGMHVPVVVAAPAILLVEYSWMILPIALRPLWLRHLNGSWFTCCSVATDLAPQAVLGAFVVAVGIAATGLLLMRHKLDAPRLLLAAVPVALAFSVGALLVQGLGPDPIVPRANAVLVCSSGAPRVCVWPEHRGRLAEVSTIATQTSAAWRQFNALTLPGFSEQTSLSPSERSFGFSLDSQRSDIILSLAYSLLPPYPACALDGSAPFLGADAEPYVMAWLADVAGLARSELAARFGPDVLRSVAVVRSLPPKRQQAWFKQNLAALGACDVAPQLEPRP